MVTAHLNAKYESIRNATYGIVFFATPHNGGNFVPLAQIASNVARALLRNPENNFLQSLEKDSLFGDELNNNFRHCIENFYILSFFETLPFNKMGLVSGPVPWEKNHKQTDRRRLWIRSLQL
jgi:hypothetical protein